MSTQALPPVESVSRQETTASTVLCDLMADVGMALSFSERSTKAITFTVPDRNGDSLVETIRYAWSGRPATCLPTNTMAALRFIWPKMCKSSISRH